MTIKQMKAVTKCHIFVERTDEDGQTIRTEWTGGPEDYQIANLKIIHAKTPGFIGFALAVELEEGGA